LATAALLLFQFVREESTPVEKQEHADKTRAVWGGKTQEEKQDRNML